MDSELDVIDAFVDGEYVDREALKRALTDSSGRDYLIDVLDLRAFTADVEPEAVAFPMVRRRSWRSSLAAAAAVLLCVVAAYVVGHQSGRAVPNRPAAATVANRAVPAGGLVQAPAPTHVIRLDPDANWSETPGGK